MLPVPLLTGRQVGNEFGQVESLWSQFEGVMKKPTESPVGDSDAPKQSNGEK